MSLYVFVVETVDLSEGLSDIAAIAGEDHPMTLETAVWLDELAGPLGFPAWSVADLRGAIRRGELRPERHGHRILVTRRQVREWRERVRMPEAREQSPTTPPKPVALDPQRSRRETEAALAIARRLIESSRKKPRAAR